MHANSKIKYNLKNNQNKNGWQHSSIGWVPA
jgi:hypothetical protein